MVGFWMGPRVLIAFIAGCICSGGSLAIFCQNAGSIWYGLPCDTISLANHIISLGKGGDLREK